MNNRVGFILAFYDVRGTVSVLNLCSGIQVVRALDVRNCYYHTLELGDMAQNYTKITFFIQFILMILKINVLLLLLSLKTDFCS